MSSFESQFSTAAPVLAMSPQPVHRMPFGGTTATVTQQQLPPQPSVGIMPLSSTSGSTIAQAATTLGRKRSRDEAAINLEPDIPAPAPKENEAEWVLGPGMTLIKADKGYVADASSQSGTWIEEQKAADEQARLKYERETLAPRSHKLQRVIIDPTPGSSFTADSPSPTTAGPVVDDFTMHLGIGWRKINEDEDIQAAARGWARYIENHYPVTNARIRLESKGLESYLVEASEGFFLFAENLHQGRLVSISVEGAIQNLQLSPPVFEGANVMMAADSPPPSTSQPAVSEDAEMSLG